MKTIKSGERRLGLSLPALGDCHIAVDDSGDRLVHPRDNGQVRGKSFRAFHQPEELSGVAERAVVKTRCEQAERLGASHVHSRLQRRHPRAFAGCEGDCNSQGAERLVSLTAIELGRRRGSCRRPPLRQGGLKSEVQHLIA